jgi:hypothetical protein
MISAAAFTMQEEPLLIPNSSLLIPNFYCSPASLFCRLCRSLCASRLCGGIPYRLRNYRDGCTGKYIYMIG